MLVAIAFPMVSVMKNQRTTRTGFAGRTPGVRGGRSGVVVLTAGVGLVIVGTTAGGCATPIRDFHQVRWASVQPTAPALDEAVAYRPEERVVEVPVTP